MGAWTEIVDFTFTANETSRTFSGLNITKDDFIKVVATITNGSSSGIGLAIFPNTSTGVSGFNTNTNYHRQELGGLSSTVYAQRLNDANITAVAGSVTGQSITYIKLSENGKFNSFTNFNFSPSNLHNSFLYNTSSNLTFNDPITSLTFTASVTNGLGTGSRIQIYRLDAEKVADINITSTVTAVDISSLNIAKDSEYLLITYIGLGGTPALMVNDNTTFTNYYRQRIGGVASTASTDRVNDPAYCNGENVIAYTHIKLSEIGAFTFQSYVLNGLGTTAPSTQNWFGSSTAENITSITKLNIRSINGNIQSGSRFELYKLK
jgi:hypothetical protein